MHDARNSLHGLPRNPSENCEKTTDACGKLWAYETLSKSQHPDGEKGTIHDLLLAASVGPGNGGSLGSNLKKNNGGGSSQKPIISSS